MIDLYFRAFSRERWLTVATNRGIYVDGLDTAGNPIKIQQLGFAVDEIGNIQLTDPVYDNSTDPPTLITPAAVDTWWTVNLRIYGGKFSEDQGSVYPGEDGGTNWRFIRSKLVKFVRDQATLVLLPFRGDTVRAYEFGALTNRIQLLDPRDITAWPRVWLGGMSL